MNNLLRTFNYKLIETFENMLLLYGHIRLEINDNVASTLLQRLGSLIEILV